MKGFERLAFSAAIAAFAFLYGWGAGAFGWIPGPTVAVAFLQAESLLGPRAFLQEKTYDRGGARTVLPQLVAPGVTLVTSTFQVPEGWHNGARLIDVDGRVVHEWRVDPTELFAGTSSRGRQLRDAYIHGAHLLENGDLIVNIETVGAVRIDACSHPVWKVEEHNHHSVAMDDRGDVWTPVIDYWDEPSDMEGSGPYPGLETPLFNTRILKLSGETGETLDEVRMLDVLYANGLERYLVRSGLTRGDIIHMNDAEPLAEVMADEYPLFDAGDLLVSLRNSNLVLVLDPRTGDVKWYSSDLTIQQHDPDFLGDGWIGVFDNNRDETTRGTTLGGSRIVAVQPHTGETKTLYPVGSAERIYTEQMGKWQQLPNGNLLLTEAQAGRVLEVSRSGELVWEWIHDVVDDRWIPEVSEGTRYSIDKEQIARWPCTTHPGE